jgi:hypothetical protein
MRKRYSDCGFSKIRRSLREHLAGMTSDAVKLYLWLHLVAFWSGKKRGTVETSYPEIAEDLRWPVLRVKRAIRELLGYYVKIKSRGNQHRPTTIRILRYDNRPKSAGIKGDTSKRASITGAPSTDTSTDTSRLPEPNETLTICTPKKAVEGSRCKEAASSTVWSFLKIEPCGPPKFRELLESRWASRNGEQPSVLIGETVDAWKAVEGEIPRRARELFRALAALRKNEQSQQAREIEEEIPIAQADL